MKTARRIAEVVGAVFLLLLGGVVVLVVVLGPVAGLLVSAAVATGVVVAYHLVLSPWHSTWGATPAEAEASLPGDDLVPTGTVTTRAITIDAAPGEVWPWLVQIGFGRGGWYSYDHLDNDGLPSATEIIARFQDLAVGDRIPMTPDLGFVVRELTPPETLIALSDDGSTSWVLRVVPGPEGGTRLTSRFRSPRPTGPAGWFWSAIGGPGAFIMERRMLLGIRDRAEAHVVAARA